MNWKVHVTVAAVIEQQGRFLLVEEAPRGRPVLNQPAGHLEAGESLIDAVIREVAEETAHPFTPQALVGVYLWRHSEARSYLRVTFCGSVGAADTEQPLDTGILGTLWLTREQLQQQHKRWRSPLVGRCIDDYLAGRRHPLDMLTHLVPHA